MRPIRYGGYVASNDITGTACTPSPAVPACLTCDTPELAYQPPYYWMLTASCQLRTQTYTSNKTAGNILVSPRALPDALTHAHTGLCHWRPVQRHQSSARQ